MFAQDSDGRVTLVVVCVQGFGVVPQGFGVVVDRRRAVLYDLFDAGGTLDLRDQILFDDGREIGARGYQRDDEDPEKAYLAHHVGVFD